MAKLRKKVDKKGRVYVSKGKKNFIIASSKEKYNSFPPNVLSLILKEIKAQQKKATKQPRNAKYAQLRQNQQKKDFEAQKQVVDIRSELNKSLEKLKATESRLASSESERANLAERKKASDRENTLTNAKNNLLTTTFVQFKKLLQESDDPKLKALARLKTKTEIKDKFKDLTDEQLTKVARLSREKPTLLEQARQEALDDPFNSEFENRQKLIDELARDTRVGDAIAKFTGVAIGEDDSDRLEKLAEKDKKEIKKETKKSNPLAMLDDDFKHDDDEVAKSISLISTPSTASKPASQPSNPASSSFVSPTIDVSDAESLPKLPSNPQSSDSDNDEYFDASAQQASGILPTIYETLVEDALGDGINNDDDALTGKQVENIASHISPSFIGVCFENDIAKHYDEYNDDDPVVSIIYNTLHSDGNGVQIDGHPLQHYCLLQINHDTERVLCFDPLGLDISPMLNEQITKILESTPSLYKIKYNTVITQDASTSSCGFICLDVLRRLENNDSWDEATLYNKIDASEQGEDSAMKLKKKVEQYDWM